MSQQIISSDSMPIESDRQLLLELTTEAAATIIGGQQRRFTRNQVRDLLGKRDFRNKCEYSDPEIFERRRQLYVRFTATCPVGG
ncbi:hypothetical protein CLI64_06000 [Nostoc sp. CENA543]|uniref:hypothetical protein n=1 Tax=Nostoc sp. CENA543 TaxID=1869241 RepID=UPI000CA1F33F|nr:hypothetical protein [Nostoc sp. CENA543]AUS99972.1 hypothetical protein CLI64_06000 [Nostoc sp. CENA543]